MSEPITLSIYGARKAEDRRFEYCRVAAFQIKDAIDHVRAKFGVDAEYPSSITFDRQTFMWSELVKPESQP